MAVAVWLTHSMFDADERGRKAIDQFFRRPADEGSALDVPCNGAH